MLIVKSTWQKLSNTIDIILSNQNSKERMEKLINFNKPLDFELEFSNRPHPFETFEMFELPKLANVDRTDTSSVL